MKTGNLPARPRVATESEAVFSQFRDLFADKGWLNQILRVQQGEHKYRILCTEKTFIAYRINEHYGVSPGMPGWAVCVVDSSQIIEDASLPDPGVDELTAQDWLRCLAHNEYELI